MVDRPTVYPKWADVDETDPVSGQSNVVEPPAAREDSGWTRREIPPRQWMNWLHRFTYRWIAWFDQEIQAATNLPTPSVLAKRDANGRMRAADPVAPQDVVTLAHLGNFIPFYPETTTGDGFASVTDNGDGSVRLEAGAEVVFRGTKQLTTAEQDFATAANKTYHLRLAYDGTVSLEDLDDAGYNAGALDEADTAFDSTYEDALLARVVTNGSNVPTITALKNKHDLSLSANYAFTVTSNAGQNAATGEFGDDAVSWARTPKQFIYALASRDYNQSADFEDHDRNELSATMLNRYEFFFELIIDNELGGAFQVNARA